MDIIDTSLDEIVDYLDVVIKDDNNTIDIDISDGTAFVLSNGPEFEELKLKVNNISDNIGNSDISNIGNGTITSAITFILSILTEKIGDIDTIKTLATNIYSLNSDMNYIKNNIFQDPLYLFKTWYQNTRISLMGNYIKSTSGIMFSLPLPFPSLKPDDINIDTIVFADIVTGVGRMIPHTFYLLNDVYIWVGIDPDTVMLETEIPIMTCEFLYF